MTMVLIASALYLAATGLLVLSLGRGGTPPRLWLAPAALATALHAGVHLWSWRQVGLDLHFYPALSLVALGMSALTTLTGATGRMAALGVVVYPIAAAMLVLGTSAGQVRAESLDWRLQLHAGVALLGYATLALAALLALMLWVQERALRRREFHRWLRPLPPLIELETLLFRTIAVGFALLTATLLTGVLFVEDLFVQHLAHKTILSVLSWLAFGVLLLGRWRYGWRGVLAVRWTLVSMALLVLAFFGSKYVLEEVLKRAH